MTRQTLTFDGVPLDAIEGESVLECLERHNYAISSGCRAGACQSCLLQAAEVDPPTSSITGLNKRMIRERLFMACQAKALEMFSVQTPTNATVETWDADVLGIKLIHHDVSLIQLGPKQPLAFQHGQFLKLSISGGLTRSYSIASSALDPNPKIEFHVRHVPHGAMTTYLANQLRIGDKVQLYGPFGAMEYDGDSPEKNLLLIGSGTGLGPLYSLATAALAKDTGAKFGSIMVVSDLALCTLDRS